jgi:DNA-binding beta-propeller fold protein YncE
MKLSAAFILAGLMAIVASARGQAPAPADQPYKIVKTAKVGGEGRFDYVFADSDGRKLYVPRGAPRGSDIKPRINVFDLDTLQPLGEIAISGGGLGVTVDPQSGHGFTSSSPVVMFDSKTLATIKTIPVEGHPDGLFFEPATERIYVLSHEAPNVTVIDGKDGSVVGTIDLGGGPEQGQSDGKGHVYIDIEDQDNVAVVDANTMKVTAHYALGGKGTGPAGLGLDAKNHVLFVCCRDPNTCVILNADDGKIITTLPIGNGVDGAGFNPNTMEAFSSQRDGTLTIIKENSPTSFEVEQNVQTMPGAKTSTLDSKTNQIFLITAEFAPPATQAAAPPATQPQANARRGRARGQMVPGSFTILAVGK